MGAKTAQGVTLLFGDFEAELTSLQPFSKSREHIESSHLGTEGAETFLPSALYDGGEVSIEGHFDETEPEMPDGVDECVIAFPSGISYTFDAFWTELTPALPVNGKMTFSGTLKITGTVERIPAS